MRRPLVLASLACALALAPRAGALADPLKVMALGDSVTVGVGSTRGDGYRSTFFTRMRDAGFDVDMVGGKHSGPETFDNRHQGYEKASLYDLSAGIHNKLRQYSPAVILLLTGTDESHGTNFSPHAFAANLDVMIDRVFVAEKDAKLLISTVPPTKAGKNQGAKRALNELLRRTVKERAERGQAVYLVDSFALLDPAHDMADTDHPNDAGYERIGEAFADELLKLLGAERIE